MHIPDMHQSHVRYDSGGSASSARRFSSETPSDAGTEPTVVTATFSERDSTAPSTSARTTLSSLPEQNAAYQSLFPPWPSSPPTQQEQEQALLGYRLLAPPSFSSSLLSSERQPASLPSPQSPPHNLNPDHNDHNRERPLPALPQSSSGLRPLLICSIDLDALPSRWRPPPYAVEPHHRLRREAEARRRQVQLAVRDARRAWWRGGLCGVDGAALAALQESADGFFEVQDSFFSRVAQAQNAHLEHSETGYWGRGRHAEHKQEESLAQVRAQLKDTVEALQPLLAYGPPQPAVRPRRQPSAWARKPPPAPAAADATSAASAALSMPSVPASTHHYHHAKNSNGSDNLPLTPPMSPKRKDHAGADSDQEAEHRQEKTPETWRQSMKRASYLFGFGSSPRSTSDHIVK